MKLIESKAEYIPQTDLYKHIELCGRTAYKSEDKITEDSAKGFVDRMVKSKHGAVLEHGTVYLEIDSIAEKDLDRIVGRHKLWTLDDVQDSLRTNPTYNKYGEENWWAKNASHIAKCMFNKYATNQYSNVNVVLKEHELNTDDRIVITPTSGYPDVRAVSGKIFSKFNAVFITTNLRVLIENEWLDDLKYLCEPTEFHEKRYTIKFTTDRSVSHELVRHRKFSFVQESQRYCGYDKDKFGKELTFIMPQWYIDSKYDSTKLNEFDKHLEKVEDLYMFYRECDMQPQEARAILPNCIKTEVLMTGFSSDWARLFELRLCESTGKVAPDMKVLMQKVWKEFENYGITRDLERYIKL